MALHVVRRCDVTRRPRRAKCSTSSAWCSGPRRSDAPGPALALIASGAPSPVAGASLLRGRAAARAVTLEENLPAHDLVTEALRLGQLDAFFAAGVHIA